MTIVLMLCLVLSRVLSYAHNTGRTEQKGDGRPIELIESTSYGGLDKSNAITPIIDGHVLSVVFSENLGQVTIEVSTAVGSLVHYTLTPTPNGVQVYIPDTGNYIITFTLPDGDEYYGEFTVTD